MEVALVDEVGEIGRSGVIIGQAQLSIAVEVLPLPTQRAFLLANTQFAVVLLVCLARQQFFAHLKRLIKYFICFTAEHAINTPPGHAVIGLSLSTCAADGETCFFGIVVVLVLPA